jgi:tetratricopeptide (TPR) repeat protein
VDLDALWDFNQPAVSEERFRAALGAATGEEAQVLRTQLARSLALQRRFTEASAELDAVAGRGTTPLVRTYLALERGRVANSSGHPVEAARCSGRRWPRPRPPGSTTWRRTPRTCWRSWSRARRRSSGPSGALAIAEASADPRARRWVGSVTPHLGWTLHDLGRYEEAQSRFERALAFREEQGDAEPIRIARWTVARGLRSLGRHEEALSIQRSLATRPEDGYVSEELGELLLALDRPAEARPHFARAYALLSADAWLAEGEPDRLRRLAELSTEK